jgi:hypothetical protein
MISSILHTQFLVHWTGKDFHDPVAIDTLTDALRDRYLERLIDDIQNGFYMRPGTEHIHGSNRAPINVSGPRTCFTEIKLTQARNHAQLYGRLGIGVLREFVLERQGNPVFYVQNGDNSAIVENMDRVRGKLSDGSDELKQFEVLLAYAKAMSDDDSSELRYYDELEWRVVHLDRLVPKYFYEEDKSKKIYRVRLKPTDVKLVVFPDSETKEKAIRDERLALFLSTGPILVTLDDCEHF